jgi:CrcB protein
MALAFAIGAAGGAGAVLRYLLARLVHRLHGSTFPWGTLVVNVTGCLLLGVVAGLAQRGTLGAPWADVLGAGLLGGYTTYSTFNHETLQLFEDRALFLAGLNVLGTLTLCGVAGSVGLWAGRAI